MEISRTLLAISGPTVLEPGELADCFTNTIATERNKYDFQNLHAGRVKTDEDKG